jgi:broad specificity phosphatase PhoE
MANVCEDTCSDGTCCRSDVCAPGCDDDCNCDANLTSFSPKGANAIGDPLVSRLKALKLRWDRILVSPTFRTQTTIKAYLESEELCGEIVPELEECWNDSEGTCASPPWSSDPYEVIEFSGGATRLAPRAYCSRWDPDPSENLRPSYDHSEGNAQCESIIVNRALEYIEGVFSSGAMAVLAVTHAMTGEALLAQLTGTSDYSLENAPAYTVLTRLPGTKIWRVQVSNGK